MLNAHLCSGYVVGRYHELDDAPHPKVGLSKAAMTCVPSFRYHPTHTQGLEITKCTHLEAQTAPIPQAAETVNAPLGSLSGDQPTDIKTLRAKATALVFLQS